MANYNDQARAIWSALDDMLQKDPEGYKQFVSEQMKEGRKMIKKQQTSVSNLQGCPNDLEKAFGKILLGSDSDDGGSVVPKQESKRHTVDSTTTVNGLLDDEIGGRRSILEQIVKTAARKGDKGKESDEDDVKVTTLEINGAGGSKGSRTAHQMKKPLIEEI